MAKDCWIKGVVAIYCFGVRILQKLAVVPALTRGGIPRPVDPKAVPRARGQRRQMRMEHIAVALGERYTMLGSRCIK